MKKDVMHPAYLRYSNDDNQFCAIILFACDAFLCRNNAIKTFCSINICYMFNYMLQKTHVA